MKQKMNLSVSLILILSSQLVMAQAPAAAEAPPAWMQFVPIAVIMLVFYFFMIRPQAKKQQELKTLLESLKSGDQVITNSGILGRISGLNENVVTLEISQGVQIKILKSQILGLQSAVLTQK